MDKTEILEKSRAIKKDEGLESMETKGLKIGFAVFCILYLFMAIFNLFYGYPETGHALSALFWAFFASLSFARYRFTTQVIPLFTAIAAGLCSLLNVVNFVRTALG